jgi:hypothetical protein
MPCREYITVASACQSRNSNYAVWKRRRHFWKIRSLIFLALCAAGVFVLYITISSAHDPKGITQRGNFSREILEGDRTFLDHLFEKTNNDDRTGRESSLVPM